jgi:hypothetical protein
MQDKRRELGVFTIGIAIIFGGLAVYVAMISDGRGQQAPLAIAILLIPSLVLVLAGICVLVMRSALAVRMTAVIVTLTFLADAVMSLNPIKWLVSAACLYLVWKTARQAIAQLQGGGNVTQPAASGLDSVADPLAAPPDFRRI